jgi:uncharacterized protein (TIGR02001 family)
MKIASYLISGLFFISIGHAQEKLKPVHGDHRSAPIIGRTKTSRYLSSPPVQKIDAFELDPEHQLKGQFNVDSNYVWRGISQTNNQPAAQGGLSFSPLTTGLYGSIWVSNVNFEGNHQQTARVEWEPSIGYADAFNKNFNYDVGLTRYVYPNGISDNYNEFNAYATYYILTAHLAYSNDNYGTGQNGAYYNAGFNYQVPSDYSFHLKDVSITGGFGYSYFSKKSGLRSYQDYTLSLNKVIHQVACSLQWTDTNRHSTDPASVKGNLFALMVGMSF